MCVCICIYAVLGRPPTTAELQSFERFDRNLDGRLGEAELIEALEVKQKASAAEPVGVAATSPEKDKV